MWTHLVTRPRTMALRGAAHLPGDAVDVARRLGVDEEIVTQSPRDDGVGDTCGFGNVSDGHGHIAESTSIPGSKELEVNAGPSCTRVQTHFTTSSLICQSEK